MPTWDVGRDDLLRGKLIEDFTWYCCLITKSEMGLDKGTKGAPAGLWRLSAKVLNDGKWKDIPIDFQFSEKAKGMSVRFLEAVGAQINPESGAKLNTDAVNGRRVEIFVDNRTWEGRLLNNAKDFRPCPHEVIPANNANEMAGVTA